MALRRLEPRSIVPSATTTGTARFIAAPGAVLEFCRMMKLDIVDCSTTRTGTHKDFKSARLLETFGEKNPVFYLVTMGNAGYSLGRLANDYNEDTGGDVRVVTIVDFRLDKKIKDALQEVSTILECDLSKKIFGLYELRGLVKAHIRQKRPLIHGERIASMYKPFVTQVSLQYPNHDYLFLPVGTGELFSEMLRYARFALCRNPHGPRTIVPVTVEQNVFSSRYNARGSDYSVADKLVTPTSRFTQRIREIIGDRSPLTVSNEEIMEAYVTLVNAGIRLEPSAAVAFAGLRKVRLENALPPDAKVAVINTGCSRLSLQINPSHSQWESV